MHVQLIDTEFTLFAHDTASQEVKMYGLILAFRQSVSVYVIIELFSGIEKFFKAKLTNPDIIQNGPGNLSTAVG